MVTTSYGLNRLSDLAAARSVSVTRKAKSASVINEVIFTSCDVCVIKPWVNFFRSLAVQVLNKWWLGGGEQKFKRKFHCWSNTLLRSSSYCEKPYCRLCFLTFLCTMMTKHCQRFTGKTHPESPAASLVLKNCHVNVNVFILLTMKRALASSGSWRVFSTPWWPSAFNSNETMATTCFDNAASFVKMLKAESSSHGSISWKCKATRLILPSPFLPPAFNHLLWLTLTCSWLAVSSYRGSHQLALPAVSTSQSF